MGRQGMDGRLKGLRDGAADSPPMSTAQMPAGATRG